MRNEELAEWLVAECDRRNLSWSEASRRAGLAPNTISEIVNGSSAGPKRLLQLAQLFAIPPENVFRMAGILPPAPDTDLPPAIEAKQRRLVELLADLPEAAQHRVMDAVLLLIDVQEQLSDKPETTVLPQTPNGERAHP